MPSSSTSTAAPWGRGIPDSTNKQRSVYSLAPSIDIANPVFTGVPGGITPYSREKNDATTKAVFLQQNLSFYDRVIATVVCAMTRWT